MQINDTSPPMAGCRAAQVSGRRGGEIFQGSDWVAVERPVAFEYNGVSHAVMLATPDDLEDFAYGFSVTEGIVDDRSQIRDVEVSMSQAGYSLHIEIASSCFARLKDRRRSMAGRTGCGLCGTDSLGQAVRMPVAINSNARFSAAAVERALSGIRARQALSGFTGATHAAAWCNAAGDIVTLREDVGRHNALDKLIGALQRASAPAESGFFAVTSRASYEMVHKTAVAGVALLAAVSGVTGLAIEVAQHANVALLGFVRGQDVSVYCHAQRLLMDDKQL